MPLNLAVMLYFFILELNVPTAATSHEFYCKTQRERERKSCAQISVDVETLSCIEECLPNPPKHDCRKAHPKNIQCPNYNSF
jgi:hypothetical protein